MATSYCNTGVSQQRYRDAVKTGDGINWRCVGCTISDLVPVAESTRVDNEDSLMSFMRLTPPGSLILEVRDDPEENATDDAALGDTVDQPELESERSISYEIPPQIEESSIEEPVILDNMIDFQPPSITYEIVDTCTKRGQRKLFDSCGYSYTIKRRRDTETDWTCSIRGKNNRCPGSVIQRADGFHTGVGHKHAGEVGLPAAAKLVKAVKRKAEENLFRPASEIDNVLLNEIPESACPTLPKVEHLIRATNRLRQAKRPQDPKDLDFSLEEEHIPDDFFKADIRVHGRRHLIFATTDQLSNLARAKGWYVDGTFKLCHHPFSQLFTVNAFVCHDDHVKQVPLAFVLMSGRKKSDYIHVLKKLLEIIPAPKVQRVTVNFEWAIWRAFSKVMSNIEVKGCAFHWTQAVWRKVQGLGLQTVYTNDKATNSYVRRLMALPFLPHETILAMFEKLAAEATTPVLQQLVMYIRSTWIESEVWSPCSWSVFMFSIRTNNDIEGWHHGLHRRAAGRCGLPLYVLLNFLHEEACLTTVRIRLVSERRQGCLIYGMPSTIRKNP